MTLALVATPATVFAVLVVVQLVDALATTACFAGVAFGATRTAIVGILSVGGVNVNALATTATCPVAPAYVATLATVLFVGGQNFRILADTTATTLAALASDATAAAVVAISCESGLGVLAHAIAASLPACAPVAARAAVRVVV